MVFFECFHPVNCHLSLSSKKLSFAHDFNPLASPQVCSEEQGSCGMTTTNKGNKALKVKQSMFDPIFSVLVGF